MNGQWIALAGLTSPDFVMACHRFLNLHDIEGDLDVV